MAYQAALRESANDDFIFVGGSSYVVADLLTALQEKEFSK
jgi:dihydrofolate synthase/folylpolyglutamate synthase